MLKKVHIFSAGPQTSAQGVSREFTRDDLQQVVDSYNPAIHEAPVRVGHQDNDTVPAFGWIKDVSLEGDKLYAEVDFSPQMKDMIADGLYKKVSASFYSPESKINPADGKWSLRHLAVLGAQPPAVKGLEPFGFSEDEDGCLDFAAELTIENVFDEELGPTLRSDHSPLEMLQEKLEEARSEMASQEKMENELVEEQKPVDEAEFAEEKKPKKGKEGMDGADEEVDEDEVDSMEDDVKHGDCGSMKKKNYKEDEEMHAESCGKKKKANYEEEEGEEMDAEPFGEPTNVPSEQKRGSDGLNSSDDGVKKTKKSKIFESDEEVDEMEKDNDKYNETEDFAATACEDGKEKDLKSPPAKGMSGMTPEVVDGDGPVASKVKKKKDSGDSGVEPEEEEYEEVESEEDEALHMEEDATGRNKVGKAGEEGKTGRSKTAKSKPDPTGRSKTAKSKKDPAGRSKTASAPAEDRDSVGKAGESGETGRGEPESYSIPKGSGSAVKNGAVRVEYVYSEMMERLEALEAQNAKLVAEKQAAERHAHRMQLEEFAESLYDHGKLTPAMIEKDELVDYMEGLEHGTLEFSEGESAATKLMEILAALPSQVSYSEVAAGAVAASVDYDSMDPHAKALHIMEDEGMEYSEALKKALFTGE